MKKSLSAYVIFSIAILLAYTIAEFYSTDTTGITHDTLTTCFFAAFGGEILSCALIRIFKLKNLEKKQDFDTDIDADPNEGGEG